MQKLPYLDDIVEPTSCKPLLYPLEIYQIKTILYLFKKQPYKWNISR